MQATLKDFVEFMQTAFGILAGITTFFPFANLLTPIIPLPKSIKQTAIVSSSIASAFVIYFVFSISKNSSIASWISFVLFIVGILSLLFIVYVVKQMDDDEIDTIEIDSSILTLLLLSHVLVFACITMAFSILAANDFWSSRNLGM